MDLENEEQEKEEHLHPWDEFKRDFDKLEKFVILIQNKWKYYYKRKMAAYFI